MGGYGSSIQTVVKNNKNLLRERKFLNNPNSKAKSKLEFNKVSEEKLNQIKESIQVKAKKERIKSRLKLTALFIICLFISVYLVVEVFTSWIIL